MKEYESLERINTEPFRSYYIPFSLNDEFKYKYGIIDRKSSSLFYSLDGDWNIKELNSPEEFNLDEDVTNIIDVPSCVQMRGYDHIQYINCRVPFPFMPPYVPYENPTYHYRRTFNYKKNEQRKYYINFEGVDSAFYLYINKKYIGYSQIAHSMSEFDITDALSDGLNTIDVEVLKWCASSYMECQDKFRFTGIYRSVYILDRPAEHITDYKIETSDKDLKFINKSETDIKLIFKNKEYEILKGESLSIHNKVIAKWTSENPKLYDLILESNGEKILEKVGFRDIKITGKIFTINDEKIKLKGVNRHEFNMKNGATVSLKDMVQDLKLMKELNVNAIRTSHYPDAPEFYNLTDKMGFYLIDEADLEMHEGATCEAGYDLKPWRELADNEFFSSGILDRETSLLERDKNRPSVIIWSMGNESSYGKAFFKGNKYLKEHDQRPIHYEGIFNAKDYYYTKDVDMISMMYPSPEYIRERVLNDPKEFRPFILCEYSHAMGNSNGDLHDYWDLIYNTDEIMGAFVWEWADHGIYTKKGFMYGGDFKETDHDSNFCIDGLLTPDRKFKSGTRELQAIYAGKMECTPMNIQIPFKEAKGIVPVLGFNENTGELNSIKLNDEEVLLSPVRVNINKFIDNERADQWKVDRYKLKSLKPYVMEHTKENNKDIFKCVLAADTLKPALSYTISYELINNSLSVSLEYEKAKYIDMKLPRIGIEFNIDKKYSEFYYIGFGPYESYIDKHYASDNRFYKSDAESNYYHYIRPQESGSHYDSKLVGIENLMDITADKNFSFSVNPYSTKDILNAMHDYELKTNNYVTVCLDIYMSGVGTHSCGPVLKEEYTVPDKGSNTFKLTF